MGAVRVAGITSVAVIGIARHLVVIVGKAALIIVAVGATKDAVIVRVRVARRTGIPNLAMRTVVDREVLVVVEGGGCP